MEELCASCAVERKICTDFFSLFQIRYCRAAAGVRRFSCTCECRNVGQRCPFPGRRSSLRSRGGGPRQRRSGGDGSASLRSPAATGRSLRLRSDAISRSAWKVLSGLRMAACRGARTGPSGGSSDASPCAKRPAGSGSRTRLRRDGVLPCGRLASPGGSKGPSGVLRPRIGRVLREFAPKAASRVRRDAVRTRLRGRRGFARRSATGPAPGALEESLSGRCASKDRRRGFGRDGRIPGDAPRRAQAGLRGARLAPGGAERVKAGRSSKQVPESCGGS